MGVVLIAAGSYLLVSLALYMLDIFCLWELIVTAVGLFPIMAYAKSRVKVWNWYFIIKCFGLVTRAVFITVCYPKAAYVEYPISITNTTVLQMAGLTAIFETMFWCFIALLMDYATMKEAIEKCNNDKQITKLQACVWMTNFINSVLVISMFSLVTFVPAYKLKGFGLNMTLFVLCILLIRVVHSCLYAGLCTGRLKELQALKESYCMHEIIVPDDAVGDLDEK